MQESAHEGEKKLTPTEKLKLINEKNVSFNEKNVNNVDINLSYSNFHVMCYNSWINTSLFQYHKRVIYDFAVCIFDKILYYYGVSG